MKKLLLLLSLLEFSCNLKVKEEINQIPKILVDTVKESYKSEELKGEFDSINVVYNDSIPLATSEFDTIKIKCNLGLMRIVFNRNSFCISKLTNKKWNILVAESNHLNKNEEKYAEYSKEGEYIDNFKYFTYSNEDFFDVNYRVSGTGFFNFHSVFHIDKDSSKVDKVIFENTASQLYYKSGKLKKDQAIWKGELTCFSNDEIIGNFSIWQEKDANCCPSVGEVFMSYKIQRRQNNFYLIPDTSKILRLDFKNLKEEKYIKLKKQDNLLSRFCKITGRNY